MIMKKLPGLVYVGGGILAYTAAEMMVMDELLVFTRGMKLDC